jgi:chemotaxis protein CheC
MTHAAHHDRDEVRAVDRLCELASIGAGHAAGALATLVGRPIEMCVPEARVLEPGAADAPLATALGGDPREWSGVIFEVEGGLGGALGVLLPAASRSLLLAKLLGKNASIPAKVESALREVGNILASHALSAMGDVLGASVRPSLPRLAMQSAPHELAQSIAASAEARAALRIEVELCDRTRELRGLFVYAPARVDLP